MKMFNRTLTLLLCLLLSLALALPAFAAQEPSYTGDLEPYTIKWYLMGSAQQDVKMVQDAINKITVPAINAKVVSGHAGTLRSVDGF